MPDGIRVTNDNKTAYVMLPEHPGNVPGVVARTVPIEEFIPDYKGPWINLDFATDGSLIGIEILARSD